MKCQVLISTYRSLDKAAAMGLPHVEGVHYLISCQSEPMPIPDTLQRPDVEVHFSPTKGLSNNRNAALDLATAPFVLIADDDLEYSAEGLSKALAAFESNPGVDLFFFRYDGPAAKLYPPVETDLRKEYKGYNPSSIEIGMRMPSPLRFDPAFGIGAPRFGSGEEAMLLLDARAHGLNIRFFPITLCRHRDMTTGIRAQASPAVLRAEGAVIRRRYPATSLLRLPLKAMRTPGNPLRHLRYLLAGWLLFCRRGEKK